MSRTKDSSATAGRQPVGRCGTAARARRTARPRRSWPTSLGGLVQPEVARPADLDEVVEEADDAQRRGQSTSTSRPDADDPRRRPTQVRAEVAGPDRRRGSRRHPSTACRACSWWLGGPSSRISWPKPCRVNSRIRYGRQQDRHRQRDTDRDEDLPHRAPSPATSAVGQAAPDRPTGTPSPARRRPARSSAPQQRRPPRRRRRPGGVPHDPSMTAPWCRRRDRPRFRRRRVAARRSARPLGRCCHASAIASSPSSAISPSTAQRAAARPMRGQRRAARRASTPGWRCRRR